MSDPRSLHVHLSPSLVTPEQLAGTTTVVIDVLRATTTMLHALVAGCTAVFPCAAVEEAVALARGFPAGSVLLGGERHGKPLPGFDAGNSPDEYTPARCRGRMLVMTTTNGTGALVRGAAAARLLIAAFANLSAVREQLAVDLRPVHILCAGESGDVSFEDTLLAGALVEGLASSADRQLDDGRLARAAYATTRGRDLTALLREGAGGVRLVALGYDKDIEVASRIDRCPLVAEARRDSLGRLCIECWHRS